MSTDSTQESGVGNPALKRSKSEEVDRISDLTESLLLHILSFLSVVYVVRTSALSRRWQYVWTGVPCLEDLEIEDDGLYSPILANVGNLSRVKINLNCSSAFKSFLKCFSALGNVKSLHLSSSHLEQACILEPGLTVHNVNLTRLTIEAGSVWAQMLPYFFHCFPNLEVMRLAKDTSACKYARKPCTDLELVPAGLLSRLRVFVAQEFRGTNYEVGLLKYILKNSQVLDLVLLHTTRKGTAKMLQVAQKKVLNFRRASQQCVIKFF